MPRRCGNIIQKVRVGENALDLPPSCDGESPRPAAHVQHGLVAFDMRQTRHFLAKAPPPTTRCEPDLQIVPSGCMEDRAASFERYTSDLLSPCHPHFGFSNISGSLLCSTAQQIMIIPRFMNLLVSGIQEMLGSLPTRGRHPGQGV